MLQNPDPLATSNDDDRAAGERSPSRRPGTLFAGVIDFDAPEWAMLREAMEQERFEQADAPLFASTRAALPV